MRGISSVTKIVAKIFEIGHWVGAAIMMAASICVKAAPEWAGFFVGLDAKDCCGARLVVYGFEVCAPMTEGGVDMTVCMLFGIGAVIIFVLMAMMFRNLYLIFRNSENASPFQADNIRMLKEIGIFSIAVPAVGMIIGAVIRLAAGPDAAEVSINLSGILMGIIVLCLTQYFIRGIELEKDMEGLV